MMPKETHSPSFDSPAFIRSSFSFSNKLTDQKQRMLHYELIPSCHSNELNNWSFEQEDPTSPGSMKLSTRKIGDIEQRNLGGLGFASHWTVDREASKARRAPRKRSRSLSSTTKKQLTLKKGNRNSNEGNIVITDRNNCLSGIKNIEGIKKQRTIHTESLYAYMFQKLVGESEFLKMEKSYREEQQNRENKGEKCSRSYIAMSELLNPQ